MTLTTEQLLTSPKAFGLESATPLQRAICRALDGLPLGELGERADVREAFGGTLPSVGTPPREAHILAGIRSAKSLIAAAAIVRWSQVADVEGLGHGDIVRIPVVSIKLGNTAAVMRHLHSNITGRPVLRRLLVGDPLSSRVLLKHPSGRTIEVEPAALDRAGGSIVSVWLAGCVFDEEPRMLGVEDGQRNWDHAHLVALGRLRDGGQFLGVGSPWAPHGPIYDLVQEHWGRASSDMLVVRARGVDMNPTWWTKARLEQLARTNPIAYRVDALAEFADPETGLFGSEEVDACTRKAPLELPPEKGRSYAAAIDPAYRRNAFTLMVGFREGKRVRVALARQWVPGLGRLNPRRVFAEVANIVRPYRVRTLWTDQHNTDTNAEIARAYGLRLQERSSHGPAKVEEHDELVAAMRDELVELPPDPVVRSDLLSARRRVTQTGTRIVLPVTADGRHADYVPALVLLHEHLRAAGRVNYEAVAKSAIGKALLFGPAR